MKPFLLVAYSAIGLALLTTPASARYFEFYNCGEAQPFVRHDIIKDRNPKTGEWTGTAHSQFSDMRPGKKLSARLFQAKSNKAKNDFTLSFRGRPCRQFPREEEAELFKRYGLGEPP